MPTQPRIGPDGKPLPQVYPIRASDTSAIQYRMLDAVNSLRSAAGRQPVALNAKLNAAAATHSRDMSIQNRPSPENPATGLITAQSVIALLRQKSAAMQVGT